MEILEFLITTIFTLGLLFFYLLIGFLSFMFIQLISYRVFKFNLYKKLVKVLGV